MPTYSVIIMEKLDDNKEKIVVSSQLINARDAGWAAMNTLSKEEAKLTSELENYYAICETPGRDGVENLKTIHLAASFVQQLTKLKTEKE